MADSRKENGGHSEAKVKKEIKSEPKKISKEEKQSTNTISSTVILKINQKYPTPSRGAGDRVFYESLFKEKSDSDMALIYCIEYGILSAQEAERLSDSYQEAVQRKRKGVAKSSGTKEKKRRKNVVEEPPADIGMSLNEGTSTVGTTEL